MLRFPSRPSCRRTPATAGKVCKAEPGHCTQGQRAFDSRGWAGDNWTPLLEHEQNNLPLSFAFLMAPALPQSPEDKMQSSKTQSMGRSTALHVLLLNFKIEIKVYYMNIFLHKYRPTLETRICTAKPKVLQHSFESLGLELMLSPALVKNFINIFGNCCSNGIGYSREVAITKKCLQKNVWWSLLNFRQYFFTPRL